MECNFHPAGAIGATEPNHARIMQWRFSSRKLNRFNEFHDPYLRGHAASVRTFDRLDPIGLTTFRTSQLLLHIRRFASVHGRPRFAKWSVRSGLKVGIASVHPDFVCGCAAVPDGMSWLVPDRFDALEVPQTRWV
jgi:hypothetical protein